VVTPATEYDAAWKATLETFLQPCLAMAFPQLAALIDWSVPPRFLETELREIVRDSETGSMRVDKLVEVQRNDGVTELLLVHAEVQVQRDDQMPLRMFRYFIRIFDRFGRPPVSLAILADPGRGWWPGAYEYAVAGCSMTFRYATCRLAELDLGPWIAAGNPVARVIQAHRLAQQTRTDMVARRRGKLGLIRQLLESGMADAEVREVTRLIHWLLALPREDELEFRQEVRKMEVSMQMPRRSTYEQIVWEEGVEKGRQDGQVEGRNVGAQDMLLDLMADRFGACGAELGSRIRQIQDESKLLRLARMVFRVTSLADFEAEMKAGEQSGPGAGA
jgi:predicted transposase YdaD